MCANALYLRKDIEDLDRAGVDLFHVDIMDGHFTRNLAMNLDMVRQIKTITRTPIDVHLMVDNPESYLLSLQELQVEYVSFHIEATNQPLRLIQRLKAAGLKAGIALNPGTEVETLSVLADNLDYVLVMAVEPGFTGQKFIAGALEKISALKRLVDERNLSLLIEVDGGISLETGRRCIERGASILVAGTSSIFNRGADLYSACVEFKRQIGLGVTDPP
jgi:ribulose-phosphate 3-epimerase